MLNFNNFDLKKFKMLKEDFRSESGQIVKFKKGKEFPVFFEIIKTNNLNISKYMASFTTRTAIEIMENVDASYRLIIYNMINRIFNCGMEKWNYT